MLKIVSPFAPWIILSPVTPPTPEITLAIAAGTIDCCAINENDNIDTITLFLLEENFAIFILPFTIL